MTNPTSASPNWVRGFFGALLDRLIGWRLGFPPETCNYRVQGLRIPISDGLNRIEFAADLYQPILPKDTKPAGTILVCCPYGRGLPLTICARVFASRGFQVLFSSCRGTFGSGGEFDPFRTEVEDGKAVVEWMREQDWYTGTFATLGGSYLGFTQWGILCDPPKDMVTAIIAVAPHDFGRGIWETGALNLDIVSWANTMAHREEPYFLLRRILKLNNFRPVLDSIPLAQSVEKAMGGKAPWLKNIMSKPSLEDPHYAPMNLGEALERVNIPILLQGGWYDIFTEQTMEQYFRLQERGCNVALTMGPWTHNGVGYDPITTQESLAWMEKHLAQQGKTERQAPMQYYVTGAGEWRHTAKFPPPSAPYTLHLRSGQNLTSETPDSEATSSDFIFDPHNPTPTMGGNTHRKAGSVDDTALSKRSDVLSFTTAPLDEDLEVIGKPIVELKHSTDNPYADLFIRISEVDEKGMSHNITEAYQRLDPERKTNVVRLSLHWCAHRFVKGKSIRLMVAGGSHPHYARNIGTENPDNTRSDVKAVRHTIFHGGTQISKIVLPSA
ncbi:hydrolase CocE/NonD family protein [Trematosphaeria pertusa]|uniref:Hydrolase CocE/NonD family protein n=1 Tax=Trematosphaeria pertusa TaxID=390896 RepID=A0A6A6HV44_9PLEO|nr:hydrolase CocE/NonD family protein [Trematosphaeria pertusa]KAF2241956.1 hydrolase CocE/NonD family protein [Trematosphaeria pertusa]